MLLSFADGKPTSLVTFASLSPEFVWATMLPMLKSLRRWTETGDNRRDRECSDTDQLMLSSYVTSYKTLTMSCSVTIQQYSSIYLLAFPKQSNSTRLRQLSKFTNIQP